MAQRPSRVPLDLPLASAAGIAVAAMTIHLQLVTHHVGQLAAWYVDLLAVAAVLAAYACVPTSPHRRTVASLAGGFLMVAAALGSLSLAAPTLLAGIICLVSAARNRPL